MSPPDFMWAEWMRGASTWPFFLWVPVETRTGETIWRLLLATGWTNEFRSTCP